MAVQRTRLGLVAYVAARDGSFVADPPGAQRGPRPPVLRVPVPPRARGGRLVAFRLEPAAEAQERGADSGASGGRQRRARPAARGRPAATDYGDWLGTVGVDRLTRRGALRFHARSPTRSTPLRPRQPTDGLQIPAVVSPFLATLAGPDRELGVTVTATSSASASRPSRSASPGSRRARPPTSWSSTGRRSTARSTPRRQAPALRRSSGWTTMARSTRACASRLHGPRGRLAPRGSSTRCAPSRSPAPHWRCWRRRR